MPQGWTAVPETSPWTPVREAPVRPAPVPDETPRSWWGQSAADADTKGSKTNLRRFANEALTGLGETVSMLRHPLDTLKAFGRGAADAAEAIPDVARHLVDPETRGATASGFVKGAFQGGTGLDATEAQHDPWKAAGGFTGRVVIPALATKGIMRGGTALRGLLSPAPEAAAVETAAQTGLGAKGPFSPFKPTPPEPEPYHLPTVPADSPWSKFLTKATPETPTAEPSPLSRVLKFEQPQAAPPDAWTPVEPAPSPLNNFLHPRVSDPQLRNVAVGQAPVSAADAAANLRDYGTLLGSPHTADEVAAMERNFGGKLPEVQAQLARRRQALHMEDTRNATRFQALMAEDPTPAPAPETPVGRFVLPKPTAMLSDAEQKAFLDAHGFGDRPAGGPRASTPNIAAEAADAFDPDNSHQFLNERGAASPAFLRTAGLATGGGLAGASLANDGHKGAGSIVGALLGAAAANPVSSLKGLQQLRMIGMLSGAALPKSIAGNVGAALTAAAEEGSTAPLREMLRLPTNLKNVVTGFKGGANPSQIQGIGRFNVPARLMGAFDESTSQALQRAGLSEEETQRLLLTAPDPFGAKATSVLKTPIGQAAMPFQRTPFNGVLEGLKSVNELGPNGAPLVRQALTAGAGVAGAAAGSQTDNPIALGLLAALMGPRALPFAAGAGITAGPKVLERMSVGVPDLSLKDLYDPLRPIEKPALWRLLNGSR